MIIRQGSHSNSNGGSVWSARQYIQRLQACLNRLGYKTAVDGIFGSGTQEIVTQYQALKGLNPDGVVGPKTWEFLLKEAYAGVTSGDAFFKELRKELFNGGLSQSKVDGINFKMQAFQEYNLTVPEMAYLYATSYHETGLVKNVNGKNVFVRTMQPVEEVGKGRGKRYGSRLKMSGKPYASHLPIYYGRGDVQLTWYENYEIMGKELGINLLENPSLALDTLISAKILIVGTRKGYFGQKLGKHINISTGIVDYYNARRCVNILDKAQTIAEYALKFELALLKTPLKV